MGKHGFLIHAGGRRVVVAAGQEQPGAWCYDHTAVIVSFVGISINSTRTTGWVDVVAGIRTNNYPGKPVAFFDILRYSYNMPLAVVEAKPDTASVGEGMQQAKEYAEILGLKFAYATNGNEILEFNYLTGKEKLIKKYPTPEGSVKPTRCCTG